MKMTILLITCLFATPAFAKAQTASSGITVSGKCNVVNRGNGNTIMIKCSANNEEGKKIVAILNKILANQIDPALVMAKLDEIIAAESQKTSGTCIASNCAGTNNGTQSLTNNYGVSEPPPTIIDLKVTHREPDKSGPMNLEGPLATNPGVDLDFSLSGIFSNPMFLIDCDRPCAATMGGAWPGLNSNPAIYSIKGRENSTVIGLSVPRVDLGKRVNIVVRSKDANDISVLDVKAFIPPVSSQQ